MRKEPWKKSGGWPYITKRGKKRWHLGYRDHDGVVRSRAFTTLETAKAWTQGYVEAERRSRLREYLLGTDAPEVRPNETPLQEAILDWLALDAHPDNKGGLAPQTYHSYRSIASRHIFGNATKNWRGEIVAEEVSYGIGHLPVVEFATPVHIKPWLQAMRAAGVSAQVEKRAWAVLSGALSWAVEEDEYPLAANGCSFMQRKRAQRRASRRGGTGKAPTRPTGKRRSDLEKWALSPEAVERVRKAMLDRVHGRDPILALRDATVVTVQYQLACRNQEVWALRIGDVRGKRIHLAEVLSWGELDAGKTAASQRRAPAPEMLRNDLVSWIAALADAGFPTRPTDFLFPGTLAGPTYGHKKGHMTHSQAQKWGPKCFSPAVARVAELWPENFKGIAGATPYALRRGGISLRLRAGEDRQTVADECGTSVAMLDQHYSFVLEDLRDEGPLPAEDERRKARVAVFGAHLRAVA